MLNQEEKVILMKKLTKFRGAQAADRKKWIERRHLDKEGDVIWQKYVKKQLAWRDKYDKVERRRYRVMITRALYNLRKGKKSPHIDL